MKTREDIDKFLDNIQFLSPNEPITPEGIMRVLDQMEQATKDLEDVLGEGRKTINMWNPNVQYNKDDMVLYFKTENEQKSPEVDKREFMFILVSQKDGNDSIPNYDIVDGIPNFSKTNWSLLNPMSYLLQDLIGMKEVVKEVFQALLDAHVSEEHGLVNASDIGSNLVRKDYSNLSTSMVPGKMSLNVPSGNGVKKCTNGIMECFVQYSFDIKANQYLKIDDKRYYYEKSPVWDESDQTIFSQKYTEDDLFSVIVHDRTEKDENQQDVRKYVQFTNLRYGTNVFNAKIGFPEPFIDDEYMVFFDTYGAGEFVFGYGKDDLQSQTEPTYDTIVSMPMLLNKTSSGFDVVLPIHTHFNSMQKYNIGVPWNNVFRLHAIGRYR